MTIFSPSQTEDFLFCPIYRHLRSVEGWVLRRPGKKELGGILGTAFGVGMTLYNHAKKDDQAGMNHLPLPTIIELAVDGAVHAMQAALSTLSDEGRAFAEWDQAQLGALEPRIRRSVKIGRAHV